MRTVALAVVPSFPDGDTVLVGEYRYTRDAWSWEIPEGGGDLALDPEAEVLRKLPRGDRPGSGDIDAAGNRAHEQQRHDGDEPSAPGGGPP
jgi:hypothetical protein